MSKVCVIYASANGHTGRIAEHIGETLANRGDDVEVFESRRLPRDFDLGDYDRAIVGTPVRYARFHPDVVAFVRAHRRRLAAMPAAFFAVAMSLASKREDDRERTVRLVDELLADLDWAPALIGRFAGEIAYTRYNILVRWIIRRIARREGLATDTARDHVYTDWSEVESFAGRARSLAAPAAAA